MTDKSSRLPAYKELNDTNDRNFAAFNGAQLGNPEKGAEIIYDVVTGTGHAKGRSLPEVLPLGSDASKEIGKAATDILQMVKEWEDISALSDFPEGT